MFDIGTGELLLILVVVLLLFGPKKIPEIMASVGKGIRQFRQAQNNLKEQLRDLSSDVENSIQEKPTPKKSFSVVAAYNDEEQTEVKTDEETEQTDMSSNNSAEKTVTIRQPEGMIARTPISKSDEPETNGSI